MKWHEELLRWLLFLPALAVCCLLLGLVFRIGQWWDGSSGIMAEVGFSFAMAWFAVPLAAGLAPRGKLAVGWISLGLIVLVDGVALVLLTARGLGVLGVIPTHPAIGDDWSRAQTTEVLQAITWLIVAPLGFRAYRNREFSSSAHGNR